MEEKKFKFNTMNIIIIALSIIAISLMIFNATTALMGDRKVNMGIIQFKQHKLDIDINEESIVLSPEELTLGSHSTRTMTISNPNNSTACVLRIWLEFKIEGEINTEYLTFSLSGADFTENTDGKFYYNRVLGSGAKINNLTLHFNVPSEDLDEYQGKTYSMQLYVESIQSTRDAVQEAWKDEYPVTWFSLVEGSFTR